MPRLGILYFLLGTLLSAASSPAYAWTTAYFGGWWSGPEVIEPEDVDLSAVTHLIYFAAWLNADGTLNLEMNGIESPRARRMLSLAHASQVKVILGTGGVPDSFLPNCSALVPGLVRNLIDVLDRDHYDGVDLDWEPLDPAHLPCYEILVRALRTALGPDRLLTAAVIDQPEFFARTAPLFDQINLMTYDLTTPFPGDLVWHNTALYNGGHDVDSVELEIQKFRQAGVPAAKIGLGIDFYGYDWPGVYKPLEKYRKPPVIKPLSYAEIMTSLFQPQALQRDEEGLVPYLSFKREPLKDSEFVTFDDPLSCQIKAEYAKSHALGGVMIWELGGGFLPHAPVRDPLLQAVKGIMTRRLKLTEDSRVR